LACRAYYFYIFTFTLFDFESLVCLPYFTSSAEILTKRRIFSRFGVVTNQPKTETF